MLEASFYSGILYFLMAGLGKTSLDLMPAIKALFPYFYENSWFIGAYLITYLLSPFLNKGLQTLNGKQLNLLIGFISILWFFFPSLTGGGMYLSNLVRVIALYCIGVFLRRSVEEQSLFGRRKTFLWIFFGCWALLLLSAVVLSFLSIITTFAEGRTAWFFSTGSPLILGFAYGIVGVFISMKPFVSKPINYVASTALGVYLIHDNQYFKKWLWEDFVRTQDYPTSPWLIPHMIGWAAAIFAICVGIDFIRQYLLERPLAKYVISPLARRPDEWVRQILESDKKIG